MTTEPDLFDRLQEMSDRIERLRARELKKLDLIETELLLAEALSLLRVATFHPSKSDQVAAVKNGIRRKLGVAA